MKAPPTSRWRRIPLGALAALLALAGGCGRAPAPTANPAPPAPAVNGSATPWFVDLSTHTGLSFVHASGHAQRFWMPEIESGGVGLLDFDGDGLLDVFCVNGGSLNARGQTSGHRLFHNLGNFRFEDVTAGSGVSGNGDYGMGVACADYDGDGRPDILVTHVEGCRLYHNEGKGNFTDVTKAAGLESPAWGTSAAFLDYDQDGHLDLYVANYLRWSAANEIDCHSRGGEADYCSPLNYKAPAMDSLYHNRGDGTFELVALKAGLDAAFGHGLGVATADFDHDGRVDVFVANDATPNQLWLNQGNGRFRDEAPLRGCALNLNGMTRAGMGAVAVDLLQRGWFDLYVTHLVNEGNGVFVNTRGQFQDVVAERGPQRASLAMTGFGVGFHDFDNDGQLDAYIANGRARLGPRNLVPNDPYAEPNTLLQGLGNGEFLEVSPAGGTTNTLIATSRAAAFGDLDNDGAIDAVIVNKDGPVHLLKNVAGRRGHFIQFRVLDRAGRDALNSVVRIESGGRVQWRQVAPHEGYCASQDPRVHFGLGAATRIERVGVRWASGAAEVFGPFESDRANELREGRGRPETGLFDW